MTLTHCSICGRRLRAKFHPGGQGGNLSSSPAGAFTDWQNHRADPPCPRYGREPDASESSDHDVEAEQLRQAAEVLILSRKGWERWGKDAYLFDRHGGVGTGTVYTTAEALLKIAGRTSALDEEKTHA